MISHANGYILYRTNKRIAEVIIVTMRTKSKANLDRFKDLEFWNNEPKHAALTRLLERQIRQMRHGERLPAVRDLMARFKISQTTLDHALHELGARSLIIRRRGSGIRVNRPADVKVVRHAIGVVVSDIANPFYALLVKGIEQELAVHDYSAILCNGHKRFQTELETIHALHGKIDGAIITPTTNNVHNPEYVRYFSDLFQSREFPFLLVDIMIPGVNANFIGFDNFKAFFEMAQALAVSKMGGHQIFYLGALENIIGAERINGFRTGLQEHRVSEDSLKIINVPQPVSEINLPYDDLRRNRPAVIVAASPVILLKLIALCNAQNLRIPEDVLIAGVLEENFRDYIHDPVLGWIKPSLKLGRLSAQLIQAIIAGKPVKQITKIALERFTSKSLLNLL